MTVWRTRAYGDFWSHVLVAEGASFTGEPVVELLLHGSPAIPAAVLGALGKDPGLRLAEPGEDPFGEILLPSRELAGVDHLRNVVHVPVRVFGLMFDDDVGRP